MVISVQAVVKGTTKDFIRNAIFAALLVPSAFAVQWTTGLWGWAGRLAEENPVDSSAWELEVGIGCLWAGVCFGTPLVLSVLLCWGATWALYRGLVRNRGDEVGSRR